MTNKELYDEFIKRFTIEFLEPKGTDIFLMIKPTEPDNNFGFSILRSELYAPSQR